MMPAIGPEARRHEADLPRLRAADRRAAGQDRRAALRPRGLGRRHLRRDQPAAEEEPAAHPRHLRQADRRGRSRWSRAIRSGRTRSTTSTACSATSANCTATAATPTTPRSSAASRASTAQPCMVIGHQKGRDTKEKIHRNFGMPRPGGLPQGAAADEARREVRAAAVHLRRHPGRVSRASTPRSAASPRRSGAISTRWRGCASPIIVTVIGEGGSGGALAIAVGDVTLMLQYSTYSVISPEGCASILWKSADNAAEAAEILGITAPRLKQLGLIDKVVTEPVGGAHRDHAAIMVSAQKGARRGVAAAAGAVDRRAARDARGEDPRLRQVQGNPAGLMARRDPGARRSRGAAGADDRGGAAFAGRHRRRCRRASARRWPRRRGAATRARRASRSRCPAAATRCCCSTCWPSLAADSASSLSAVHVHHGLSPHADAWAAFCATSARPRGAPAGAGARRGRRAAPGAASRPTPARRATRAFAALDVDAVALAHHADDQAETLLLQLLRGAGPGGTRGDAGAARTAMRGPMLLRPLLALPRATLRAAARARGLDWVDDDSNADLAHPPQLPADRVAPRLAARSPATRGRCCARPRTRPTPLGSPTNSLRSMPRMARVRPGRRPDARARLPRSGGRAGRAPRAQPAALVPASARACSAVDGPPRRDAATADRARPPMRASASRTRASRSGSIAGGSSSTRRRRAGTNADGAGESRSRLAARTPGVRAGAAVGVSPVDPAGNRSAPRSSARPRRAAAPRPGPAATAADPPVPAAGHPDLAARRLAAAVLRPRPGRRPGDRRDPARRPGRGSPASSSPGSRNRGKP